MTDNFVDPPLPEKNIKVNRGIPWGGPSSGASTGFGGGFIRSTDRLAAKARENNARFNRGHDGGGMFDTPIRIVFKKHPDGTVEKILISPATLRQAKLDHQAKAKAAKARAIADEAANVAAQQLAQHQAAEAERQRAQQHA